MSDWTRVSRRQPCPICERRDWCTYVGDQNNPEVVLCMRHESSRPVETGGWLHRSRDADDYRCRPPRRKLKQRRASTIDFGAIANKYQEALPDACLQSLADELGITSETLRRFSVGWSGSHQAYTFPMRDLAGEVAGIRTRHVDGSKSSVTGGVEGLFIPNGIDSPELLLIAEGPTDTAALLDLGFDVIGRPSCSGGVSDIVELVKRHRCRDIVIAADPDEPGMRGADKLATKLLLYVPAVRVITPPVGNKDFRAWKNKKATSIDVQEQIDAANVRKLKFTPWKGK